MWNCAVITAFILVLSICARPTVSADSYDSLRSVIKKALDTLDKVDQLIESKRNSSEVIGRIIGKGYEFFSQRTTYSKLNGLGRASFGEFVDLQVNRFDVPLKDREEIKQKVFGKLKITEPGKWVEHKMLFNPEKDPDHTKYICIYGYVLENRNFDLVILEVKAAFTLAKNVLVIHNKSTGKISLEKEKLETERIPKEVKGDDIQVLLKFFEATALRFLSVKI